MSVNIWIMYGERKASESYQGEGDNCLIQEFNKVEVYQNQQALIT